MAAPRRDWSEIYEKFEGTLGGVETKTLAGISFDCTIINTDEVNSFTVKFNSASNAAITLEPGWTMEVDDFTIYNIILEPVSGSPTYWIVAMELKQT